MSLDDHLSRCTVASTFKRPTWSWRATSMLRFSLASDGVYICPVCYQPGGSLLHCPSTLTISDMAVYFCCTILGVASTGRYPASCPVKPGLSSPAVFRHLQPRSPVLLIIYNFLFFILRFNLHAKAGYFNSALLQTILFLRKSNNSRKSHNVLL